MKTVYPNLELYTWTPMWNTSIAPVQPISKNIEPTPNSIVLYTSGIAYAGWLAKYVVAIAPFTTLSQFKLSLDLIPDKVAGIKAQGYELDMMISDGTGHVYNLSNLIDMSKSGTWCVANSGGGWRSTAVATAVTPQIVNHFEFLHQVDPSKQQSLPLSLNGAAPGSGITAIPYFNLQWGTWLAVIQIQPGLNSKGGAYSQECLNITLEIDN